MKKVFWDRLVVSLTKPTQKTLQDFTVCSAVQCRYGDLNGAYYSAVIFAVNDDNDEMGKNADEKAPAASSTSRLSETSKTKTTFDIRWGEDNLTEKAVSNWDLNTRKGTSLSAELHEIGNIKVASLHRA